MLNKIGIKKLPAEQPKDKKIKNATHLVQAYIMYKTLWPLRITVAGAVIPIVAKAIKKLWIFTIIYYLWISKWKYSCILIMIY